MDATLQQQIQAMGNQQVSDVNGNLRSTPPGPYQKLVDNWRLGVTIRMRVAQILKEIQTYFTDCNEMRLELCHKHGTFNEKTQQFDFGDNETAFQTEWEELLEMPFHFKSEQLTAANLEMKKLDYPPRLDTPEPEELTAGEMLILEWLFSDFNEAVEVSVQAEEFTRKKPRKLAAVA